MQCTPQLIGPSILHRRSPDGPNASPGHAETHSPCPHRRDGCRTPPAAEMGTRRESENRIQWVKCPISIIIESSISARVRGAVLSLIDSSSSFVLAARRFARCCLSTRSSSDCESASAKRRVGAMSADPYDDVVASVRSPQSQECASSRATTGTSEMRCRPPARCTRASCACRARTGPATTSSTGLATRSVLAE